MNSAFFGKWNLDKARSRGGEAFAKALGIPDEQFAMFDKMDLTLTISKEGGGYRFNFDLKGAAPAVSYVVSAGEPVTVPVVDGTSAQLVLTIVGDTVKEEYKSDKFTWTITRTVAGKEQKVVSVAGDAKMTYLFVKE